MGSKYFRLGFFLLKFSTEMLIRTMNGTLTHNININALRDNRELTQLKRII